LLPIVNVRIGAFQDHQHRIHVTLLVDGHAVEARRSGGGLNFNGFLAAAALGLELGLSRIVGFSGRVVGRLSSIGLKRSKIGDARLSRLFFQEVYKLIRGDFAKEQGLKTLPVVLSALTFSSPSA
jgi:hypothetical protein